jgi:hypothetical protein
MLIVSDVRVRYNCANLFSPRERQLRFEQFVEGAPSDSSAKLEECGRVPCRLKTIGDSGKKLKGRRNERHRLSTLRRGESRRIGVLQKLRNSVPCFGAGPCRSGDSTAWMAASCRQSGATSGMAAGCGQRAGSASGRLSSHASGSVSAATQRLSASASGLPAAGRLSGLCQRGQINGQQFQDRFWTGGHFTGWRLHSSSSGLHFTISGGMRGLYGQKRNGRHCSGARTSAGSGMGQGRLLHEPGIGGARHSGPFPIDEQGLRGHIRQGFVA